MKFDLLKASRKLSELEIKTKVDNLAIDVLWFRAMENRGEWVISRHMHSSFEFHFIASGSCSVLHDHGQFHVGPGEFYLTAPFVYHEQRGIGTGEIIEYSLNCDLKRMDDTPTEFSQLLEVLSAALCKPYKDSYGAIRLFHKALIESYSQNLGFFNNIRNLVPMILTSAARSIGKNIPLKYEIPLKKRKDDYRLIEIERIIEDNLSNPLSTKDIATHMYLSDKQVCRIIKEKKGLSTKEFISQIKLQKARELLRETNLPVKQISDMLGFSSEYYFSQFFKRTEGYPPGIFRHNVQNV